jgi:hypothetical protein
VCCIEVEAGPELVQGYCRVLALVENLELLLEIQPAEKSYEIEVFKS